jgi:hydroxymethylglutaryl-CoA lyase
LGQRIPCSIGRHKRAYSPAAAGQAGMTIEFPAEVEVIEVGPRDGLQQLSRHVALDDKLRMIELLVAAGFRTIEATAFVRADVIPQLADAEELMVRLPRDGAVCYRALVPNRRGADRAIAAGAGELLGLITATDTYNEKNARMSVERNLEVIGEIADLCLEAGVPLVTAIGNAFFCPYEGPVSEDRLLGIIDRLREAGVERLYLATSVGMDGPREVGERCAAVLERHPDLSLGLHLHNTNGMALAVALAGLAAGVRWFEGSICGLGGGIVMPHAGTSDIGNVPSEDLVAMFASAGVATGVDVQAVRAASIAVAELLGITSHSALVRAGTRADVLAQGRERPA